MIFYLETSAINWLFDNLEIGDPISTRNYQLYKQRRWVTSSVSLWEILNTSNQKRRDKLLDYSRKLLFERLIKSPEEIIIKFLNNGCPKVEKRYDLRSKGLFTREWYQAANNLNFMFNAQGESFKRRTAFVRFYKKLIYSFIKMEKNIYTKGSKIHFLDYFVNSVSNYLSEISDKFDGRDLTVRVTIIYTYLILCNSLSLDFKRIENFWENLGLRNISDRFDYIIKHHSDIFFRGPIANISRMTIAQMGNSSRGLGFDSMHSVYLTYVDVFFTADDHFFSLSNVIDDPHYQKVMDVRNLDFHLV